MGFYRKEWASKEKIREEVADVPENWLRGFAVRHPRDFRKFAAKRNGSAMYRVSAVLKAIEDGEGMPNDGIVEVPFQSAVEVMNPPLESVTTEHLTPATVIKPIKELING